MLYRYCDPSFFKGCFLAEKRKTKNLERLVRLGKAKRTKTVKADSGTDQWEGGVLCQSEFEENDDDLADFLQNNTSFLLNMTKTAGFSVPWWTHAFLVSPIFFLDFWYFLWCTMTSDTEDLTGLVRKYLPPGTIYDTYQFYCGWCSAHSIEHQAGHHVNIFFWGGVGYFLLVANAWKHTHMNIYIHKISIYYVENARQSLSCAGMGRFWNGGTQNGQVSSSSELPASFPNVTSAKNSKHSFLAHWVFVWLCLLVWKENCIQHRFQDKQLHMESRLNALKLYRAHLMSQYADRCAVWSLHDISGPEMSRTAVCITDGADQAACKSKQELFLCAFLINEAKPFSDHWGKVYDPKKSYTENCISQRQISTPQAENTWSVGLWICPTYCGVGGEHISWKWSCSRTSSPNSRGHHESMWWKKGGCPGHLSGGWRQYCERVEKHCSSQRSGKLCQPFPLQVSWCCDITLIFLEFVILFVWFAKCG